MTLPGDKRSPGGSAEVIFWHQIDIIIHIRSKAPGKDQAASRASLPTREQRQLVLPEEASQFEANTALCAVEQDGEVGHVERQLLSRDLQW